MMSRGRPRKYNMNVHPIAKELHYSRRKRNLSLTELSEVVGYSADALGNFERGLVSPSLAKLADWCEALGFILTLEKIQISKEGDLNYDSRAVKIAERLKRFTRARRSKHVVQPANGCGGAIVDAEVD